MVIKFHSYNAFTYLFIDINLNEEFIFLESRKLIIESSFTLNTDWRRFLKDNNIKFISNFMQKLKENF